MNRIEGNKRKTGYISNSLEFVSSGLCPNCEECSDNWGYESIEEYNQAVENYEIEDEGSFSHYPCDDCNTNLGGDSFAAHGIDENGELVHFTICRDCLMEFNGYTIDENGDYID